MNDTTSQLGALLRRNGVVSEDQVRAGLEYQARHGCRLGEALVALDFCSEVDIVRALAQQDEIRFVDLEKTPPSPGAVQLIPREVALEYGIVPVRLDGSRLLVAARDPYDLRIDEVVWEVARHSVTVAAAAPSQIRAVLSRYDTLVTAGDGGKAVALDQGDAELIAVGERPAIVRKVNALIADAVRRRASHLYVEPTPSGLRIRYRIDGVLHVLTTLPMAEREAVVARVLSMNGVLPTRVPVAAEGRCRARVDGKRVELRLTVTPAADGPFLTLRAQHPDEEPPPLASLGLEPEQYSALRRACARRGLILLAGPAGSGCPTTLRALAQELQGPSFHWQVLLLQDSAEQQVSGVHHIRVTGLVPGGGAAEALRHCAVTRPDAVLLAALPDGETAREACRLAASGVLVVAACAAPDAPAAIEQLLELAGPVVAAPVLSLVSAQRLLRRVCPECGTEARVPFRLEQVLRSLFAPDAAPQFRRGRGCAVCYQIGASGQIGIFETVELDEDLRALLARGALPGTVREELRRRGDLDLDARAYARACRGEVDPEELPRLGLRVAAALQTLLAEDGVQEPAPETEPVELGFAEGAGTEFELDTWEDVAQVVHALV